MPVPCEAGGCRTEEGKEVVRWNATRHGIRSPLQSSLEWRRVKPLLLAEIIGRVANVSGTSA